MEIDSGESEPVFGESVPWTEDPVLSHPETYYPTRREWLFSGILTGLLAGTAPRDHPKVPGRAMGLVKICEEVLDGEGEFAPTPKGQ